MLRRRDARPVGERPLNRAGHAHCLIHESSPNVRKHAHHPVDWDLWGPESLDRAARKDRPVLLSIDYSACHRYHVMEHESFEDPAIHGLAE